MRSRGRADEGVAESADINRAPAGGQVKARAGTEAGDTVETVVAAGDVTKARRSQTGVGQRINARIKRNRSSMIELGDQQCNSRPSRGREAGAPDAALDDCRAAGVTPPKNSRVKVAGDQRHVGNVAPAVGGHARTLLVGRLGIDGADTATCCSTVGRMRNRIVPRRLRDVSDVIAEGVESRNESRTTDVGDIWIGTQLINIPRGARYTAPPADHRSGRAKIARAN